MIGHAELEAYCLVKAGSEKDYPFGFETAVIKVLGKMYALWNETGALSVNLKCDPDWSLLLRESYEGINPGYHMNKKHWNTVELDGSVPSDLVQEMVDHSYNLVVKGLKKADRERLATMNKEAK